MISSHLRNVLLTAKARSVGGSLQSNTPIIPPPLRIRIEHAVSWVLNPLSHSQTVDRYRVEIEDAIYAIDDLEVAVKRAMALRSTRATVTYEMIAALLKAYIEKVGTGGS
jgi:hypothetical protein